MFRFETQLGFYDFLNHVIRFFFCFCSFAGGKGAGGGGGIIESWIVQCSAPSGRLLMHILMHICIVFIYLTAFHTAFTARAKKSKKMSDFMKKPAETRD